MLRTRLRSPQIYALHSIVGIVMERYSGPEEVYEKLVDDVPEDSEWLFGLVAFAVIEEKKIEWIRHQKEHNGGEPTDEDIRNWYKQLPAGELLRAKDTAAARLRDFGETAIEAYRVDYENEMRESIIVAEIKETKRFWPQVGINMFGGFVSALLFALLLTLFAFLVFNDTSPVGLVKNNANNKTEVSTYGNKERSN